MLKINSELFSRIKDKFNSDKNIYAKIKLETSKIFFALMVTLYFWFYLCTIAWFQPELFAKLLYWIYPVFLFSIFTLIYDVIIYGTSIHYKESVNATKIPLFIALAVIYLWFIAVYLWLKLN